MAPSTSTLIIRHRKENLKKCSLRGLETRTDITFHPYPLNSPLPSLCNYIFLTLDAPPLSNQDRDFGLLIVDATWRLAAHMEKQLDLGTITRRSIPPGFVTAYPRKQSDCIDPTSGLASIEALFIAYQILQRDSSGLLDHYHWKELFFKRNERLL